MAIKQFQSATAHANNHGATASKITKGGSVVKVDPAALKACIGKQKGMAPFIARFKCLKQLGGASAAKKGGK